MTTQADTKKTYVLDGTLLEACSCGGPCPCWVGDDPDGGRWDSVNAYHIDRGRVGGVDVSNLSFVQVNQIPGNVLAGRVLHRGQGNAGATGSHPQRLQRQAGWRLCRGSQPGRRAG